MSQPESDVPAAGVPTCYRHRGRETYIKCQRCERPICPDCMRDAAVGFQCPQCVAEGARSTRAGRSAYGGQRSANPALTSMVLIGLNALVWLVLLATGGRDSWLTTRLMLTPVGRCYSDDYSGFFPDAPEYACRIQPGVVWQSGLGDGAWWMALTNAFAHLEVWHIGFNMLALWVLGPQLEAVLGRVRFLALYLVAALAGSTTVFWLSSPESSTLGASGAIWGLLGGLLVLAWKARGDVQGVLTWIGINLVVTFVFPNISWQGHIGGLLGGAAVTAILVYAPRGPRRGVWQAAGIGLLVVALVALLVVRAQAL